MNSLKKILGIVWIVAGPLALFYLIRTAMHEIAAKPVIDTKIQWGVFIAVFIPVVIGFIIFGYYALKGEYDQLPSGSDEISD